VAPEGFRGIQREPWLATKAACTGWLLSRTTAGHMWVVSAASVAGHEPSL
jgi:hypothetical protein